jgi:DNA (cytosine-5)-methyltransferase 1
MARKILVADLLCGAGGSSTGCERALKELGLEMELVCLNHWPTAIETHTKNHPTARHYCQDISTVRPHIVVPEGYLDLLMASPSCTHHSVARGGKPTSDQQRSDPWHIISWLTELQVKRLIIENVWEFIQWGPVDHRTGKPIKSRKGEYFQRWIETIRGLGFDPSWHKLNSANYGDATTRQRFILKARNDRKVVGWAPLSHAKRAGDNLLLFPALKPWRPARDIINWNIKGRSIFNRKKPLAPKTLARIHAGAVKFNWPQPFIELLVAEMENSLGYYVGWAFAARNQVRAAAGRRKRRALVRDLLARLRQFRLSPGGAAMGGRSASPMLVTLRRNANGASVDGPIPTVAANGTHIGLAEPIMISPRHGKEGAGPRPRPVSEPMPTITAGGSQIAVAEPIIMKQNFRRDIQSTDEPAPTIMTQARLGLIEPVIVNMKGQSNASDVEAPLPTQTAHAGHIYVAEPIVLGTGQGAARGADEPLPTITTGGAGSEDREGCARPMLVEPFILNRHGDGYGEARAHSVEEPAPTVSCDGGGYVVEPFVLSRHGEGAPRSVEDPTPTQVAKHSHILISPYYGSGSGETCVSAEEPLPTVTAKGRFGMVVPVTHTQGSNAARDLSDPLPTITTAKGGEFAMVMPVTHGGSIERARNPSADPLPTVTGANRGELAFIAAQFGEREGQSPRVHDIDQPTPAITATGHVNLVEATSQYDILFRMLEPEELAAAMGFDDDETKYEFAGTKTDKIKQIGNAVSVRMMKAEVKAIMADASVKPSAKQKPAKSKAA